MVDQPRKVDKGWPLSCARRLLAISWSNRGDGAMRPTHMAEERSAKAAKEGRLLDLFDLTKTSFPD